MKLKIFIIILVIILSIGCENTETNEKDAVEFEQVEDDEFLVDDDLLHRIYETGVKVPNHSKLIIDELYLGISKDETAKIYVVDIENNVGKEIGDYLVGQYISCTINSEGLYAVIGVVKDCDKIDLTSQVIVQTVISEDPNMLLD